MRLTTCNIVSNVAVFAPNDSCPGGGMFLWYWVQSSHLWLRGTRRPRDFPSSQCSSLVSGTVSVYPLGYWKGIKESLATLCLCEFCTFGKRDPKQAVHLGTALICLALVGTIGYKQFLVLTNTIHKTLSMMFLPQSSLVIRYFPRIRLGRKVWFLLLGLNVGQLW